MFKAVEQSLAGCTKVLFGYYPCDKPPTVGFKVGTGDQEITNIEPEAFVQSRNGNNNCTSIVTGLDFDLWIIGQAWFQGKYVDFNDAGKEIGVAQLKDKTGGPW